MELFLIPFVEHLTERTKLWVITKLPDKLPAYLSHHLAPLYALFWALFLVFIYQQLVSTDNWGFIEAVMGVTGGSVIWYELSSIWKEKKRKAIPLTTKGLSEEMILHEE